MQRSVDDIFREIRTVWGDRPERDVCERVVRHVITCARGDSRLSWTVLAEIGKTKSFTTLCGAVFYLAGEGMQLLHQEFELLDDDGVARTVAGLTVVAAMGAAKGDDPAMREEGGALLRRIRPYFTLTEAAQQLFGGRAPVEDEDAL